MSTRVQSKPASTSKDDAPAASKSNSKTKTDTSNTTSGTSDSATQQAVIDLVLQTNINLIMSIASQPIKSVINRNPTGD